MNLPIRNLPIINGIKNLAIYGTYPTPVSRQLIKLMPICSSHVPYMLQYDEIVKQILIQAYFVAKLAKNDVGALVGRFSSISLDLLSIFSTTNKTCKEMVKEDKFSYKC